MKYYGTYGASNFTHTYVERTQDATYRIGHTFGGQEADSVADVFCSSLLPDRIGSVFRGHSLSRNHYRKWRVGTFPKRCRICSPFSPQSRCFCELGYQGWKVKQNLASNRLILTRSASTQLFHLTIQAFATTRSGKMDRVFRGPKVFDVFIVEVCRKAIRER